MGWVKRLIRFHGQRHPRQMGAPEVKTFLEHLAAGNVAVTTQTQELDAAIAGTSNNTNGVALLGITISDPPTQGELQAVANKLDEMISAARR